MSTIQISRNREIFESRAIADLHLNEYMYFYPGEWCMVTYKIQEDQQLLKGDKGTGYGVLIAIGTKEGKGPDKYKIVSGGGIVKVRKIVYDLVDVSNMVHDEIYVYKDPDGVWNYITNDPRNIKPITGGPYIFLEMESGYRWFYENQECKREDDFFSRDKLREILKVIGEIRFHTTIKNLSGSLFKVGNVVNIELGLEAWDENKKKDLTEECEFWIDDKQITPINKRYTVKNIYKDTTIRVVAKYKVTEGIYVTDYQDIEIKFGYLFFKGVVKPGWEATQETVSKLGSIVNIRKSWELDISPVQNSIFVVAYPKKYGSLSHILDRHGMDYIYSYQGRDYSDIVFDGEEYRVYKMKYPVSITKPTCQRYIFTDPDSIEFEIDNLLDLLNAWSNRNHALGLPILDENGKISPDLLYGDGYGTFTVIKEFVTTYPDSGMKPGEVYFNTTEKKLFFAVDEVSGIIMEPEKRTIYMIDGEFYSWTGERFEKFSKIETRVINDIKEIYNVSNT